MSHLYHRKFNLVSKKDFLGSLCNLAAGSVWSAQILEAVPCNCTDPALYGGRFGLFRRHEVTPYRGCIYSSWETTRIIFGPFLSVTTKSCHGNFMLCTALSLLPAVHSTNSVDPCQDLQLPALHLYKTSYSNFTLGSLIEPLKPPGYRLVALRQASVCQDSASAYLFCSIAWLCSEYNWLVS